MTIETHTDSPYLVPFDGSFRIDDAPTEPPGKAPGKKKSKKALAKVVDELRDLQRCLYAQDRYALLLVFQAMDAAGKDGTIRAVMSGVNPAGCQVFSFKQPSAMELDHDFLWRTYECFPERGRIGIFNRSYYEEVLVVRVHPEYLDAQQLPHVPELPKLWKERYESIRDVEKHLARNGTVIVKFWLNVSRDEQKARFLSRIDEPEKNWKFSANDVAERRHWKDYQRAYEDAIRATATPEAPWYVVPADNKWFTRLVVAAAIVDALGGLDLHYPNVTAAQRKALAAARRELEGE